MMHFALREEERSRAAQAHTSQPHGSAEPHLSQQQPANSALPSPVKPPSIEQPPNAAVPSSAAQQPHLIAHSAEQLPVNGPQPYSKQGQRQAKQGKPSKRKRKALQGAETGEYLSLGLKVQSLGFSLRQQVFAEKPGVSRINVPALVKQ